MFALTRKNGNTRIYLTDGDANNDGISSPTASNFWRTDNGDQPAAALLASQAAGATPPPDTTVYPQTYAGWQNLTSKTTASPYFATDDFCTGQCWYDEDVYTPAGMPDTVYVIGSNSYGEQPCNTKGVGCGNGRSNGREVLYSTTAGDPDGRANSRTFTDLSYDPTETAGAVVCLPAVLRQRLHERPGGIHPDQHAIVINPGNPSQIFEGSDGGVIRTSGTFADASAECDSPHRNGGGPLPPASGSYLACKRLLSRIPTQLDHIDKKLSSTLQFINVAINPANPCEVMGGTQDNGTWSNNNYCDRNTFNQVIYGDGGNAVYDATNPTWRANEFTSGFGDSNFENGDPTVGHHDRPDRTSARRSSRSTGRRSATRTRFRARTRSTTAAKHVWRTWAFGAGTPGAVPQDTTPNIAFYEANCPEFVDLGRHAGRAATTSRSAAWTARQPRRANQPGDLTGTTYGADRTGGSVSWMARDGADHGTMWAATSAGRIFVSHNADASDPATVVWHRIDNAGIADEVPEQHLRRPEQHRPRVGHLLGLQRRDADHAGPCVQRVRERHARARAVHEPERRGRQVGLPDALDDGDLPVSDVVRDDRTTRCTWARTSASCGATTTERAGTSQRACLATR